MARRAVSAVWRCSLRRCAARASSRPLREKTACPSCAAWARTRRPMDGALALAGGKPLTRLLDGVRRGGRVAFPNGVEPAPRKRRGLSFKSYDASVGIREFEQLRRAIEAAQLKVPIAASYPLAQAAKAHKRLAKGHVLGKVVLRVR